MLYAATYSRLKTLLNNDDHFVTGDEVADVYRFPFYSPHFTVLPGEDSYNCTAHKFTSAYNYPFYSGSGITIDELDVHDSRVEENTSFLYTLFVPKGRKKVDKFILLLHGFNEKSWDKYYPWAVRMVRDTGRAVLLFPMAFHMNRAPQSWSARRHMFAASQQRYVHFPHILHSSLSNVAISTRLHTRPQRFVWSGLQTYYDIILLLEQIRAGKHPVIKADAGFHLFAYSIGAFLSEILMMTDHRNYFSDARLLMFCGGPVFNRISPVSKFILDSEANVNLYSFLVEHMESHLAQDERLRHYLGEEHPEGLYFRSILSYTAMTDFREARLRQIASRLYAIALEGDTVIYPHEVRNTLQGRNRDIPVQVDTISLPYTFRHETPFPEQSPETEKVSAGFDHVFQLVTDWLK